MGVELDFQKVCKVLLNYGYKKVTLQNSKDSFTDHFESFNPYNILHFQKNNEGNYLYTNTTKNNLYNRFKKNPNDFEQLNKELLDCRI